MKKNAFTLIELLAVIVILSIISLIATPVILGIINNVKEQAFKESINGIVRTAKTNTILDIKANEELVYKYENNNWEENKLDLNGEIPEYVQIKVNKDGQTNYAITDGVYCAIKEYESELKIKKISDKNDEKNIQKKYCKIGALIPTDDSCFVYYELTDGIMIENYNCYKGNEGYEEIIDVVIPEKIDGKQVVGIGECAFFENSLKRVVIPNGVTSIGSEAFYNNDLTSVTIPDSVTSIGEFAFYSNDLTSVTIPDSVTSIEYGAFYDNNLTSVTIPDSVTSIGEFAFYSNDLTSATIPDGVTSIGDGAFSDNQLSTSQAFIYNRKSDGSIDYTSLNSYAGKNRDNVIIPGEVNGVKLASIGSKAFYDNDLTSVTIPDSVTSIGEYAFYSNELTNIIIPDSVINIQDSAFSWNKLSSVTIPKNVTSIEDDAFYHNQLTSVIIKGKSTYQDFTNYGSNIFGWAPAPVGSQCSNTKCITWEGNS